MRLEPLVIIYLFLQIFVFAHSILRKCNLYEDTEGRWIHTTSFTNAEDYVNVRLPYPRMMYLVSRSGYISISISLQHFHGLHGSEGPGEAMLFDQLWIPNGCSYHRFTNHSLHKCMYHQLQQSTDNKTAPIKVIFLGMLQLL